MLHEYFLGGYELIYVSVKSPATKKKFSPLIQLTGPLNPLLLYEGSFCIKACQKGGSMGNVITEFDGGLDPFMLTALIATLYCRPFIRPVIVNGLVVVPALWNIFKLISVVFITIDELKPVS
jgi:hypothetical protein